LFGIHQDLQVFQAEMHMKVRCSPEKYRLY